MKFLNLFFLYTRALFLRRTSSKPHSMRLLNIKTMLVESFSNQNILDYAILSHRWGLEEVSFEQFQNGAIGLHNTEGYKKVRKCCEIASSVGFEYIWIDTCCIDKTNLAELTETLDSMFYYYRDS